MSNDVLLVYVHGAGDQSRHSATALKQAYDAALFEKPGPSEAVTWWQVFWDRPDGAIKEAALDAVIERLAEQPGEPADDAAELLEAIRRYRPPIRPRGGHEEGVPDDRAGDALDTIGGFYESARTLKGGEEMPDFIFRLLAGQASKDVVPYLYDGWAERMRKPLKDRLRELGKDRPLVVLAHSLGTILAYDVITDTAFKDWNLRVFVTAGSPLGIKNVVEKVRDRQGPGPLPAKATAWRNFYDGRDKVGWYGETLAGKYLPKPPLTQKLNVLNEAPNHHDLTGYLVDPDLRKALRAAVGL